MYYCRRHKRKKIFHFNGFSYVTATSCVVVVYDEVRDSSWIVNHLHLNPAQPPLPSPLTEIGQLGWGKVDLFEFLTTIAVIIIRGILAILEKIEKNEKSFSFIKRCTYEMEQNSESSSS